MPESDRISRHRKALDRFAEDVLAGYVSRLQGWPRARPPRVKEVNDAIWGTLTLHPLEVVVLDSPLLQRLRRIRQLGVVHLVYPTAGHTRLEHSVGTMHLVERLVSSMNSAADSTVISAKYLRLLRMAALCHDVGHGVMSHVSENALNGHDQIADLLIDYKNEYGDDRSLGEINSAMLVAAPAFQQMLSVSQDLTLDHLGLADPHLLLHNLILGRPIDSHMPTLHELISGPFDADKLDYMTRDAVMSGVPVVTDVNRLVQKARAVTVRPERLPQRMASQIMLQDAVIVTGVARSGNRTLDELTLGRTLLFDKIYRHHKVRAAEQMVAVIIRQISALVGESQLPIIMLRLPDDAFLFFDVNWPATLGFEPASPDSRAVDVAVDLSRRLRDRELLVRALSFSLKMPADPYDGDPEHVSGLNDLVRQLSDSAFRQSLAHEIAEEAARILQMTASDSLLDAYPGKTLEDYIAVDPPRAAPSTPTAKALLVSADNQVIGFDVEAPETPNWANSYHQTREVGYVFAPLEVVLHVAVAAQNVFRRAYGIRIADSMLTFGPGDGEHLAQLRLDLDGRGYFDTAPVDLRPLPQRLQMADVPPLLSGVVASVSGYSGPLMERTARQEGGISEQRVRDWAAQFRGEELVDAALRVVGDILMVGRREITGMVRAFVGNHPEFANSLVVPLGTFKDSSAINTYYALDVADEFHTLEAASLADALLSQRPLLLVDDIAFSGTQAASIVHAWFGNTAPASDLGESRQVLPDDLQALLRERPTAILFAAGTTSGLQAIRSAGGAYGFGPIVQGTLLDDDLPRCFGSVEYASEAQRAAFESRCRDIGIALLEDDPKRDERALGYGNEALLLVFPYNTPTQSLTCLWKAGVVDSTPWQPLFPRRRKR